MGLIDLTRSERLCFGVRQESRDIQIVAHRFDEILVTTMWIAGGFIVSFLLFILAIAGTPEQGNPRAPLNALELLSTVLVPLKPTLDY